MANKKTKTAESSTDLAARAFPPAPPPLFPDEHVGKTPEQLAAEGYDEDAIRYFRDYGTFVRKVDSLPERDSIYAAGLDVRVLFVLHREHSERDYFTSKHGSRYTALLKDRLRKRRLLHQSKALHEAAMILRRLTTLHLPFDPNSWFPSLHSGYHERVVASLPLLDAYAAPFTLPTRREAASKLKEYKATVRDLRAAKWQGVPPRNVAQWQRVSNMKLDDFFPVYVFERALRLRALWEVPLALPTVLLHKLASPWDGGALYAPEHILDVIANSLDVFAEQVEQLAKRNLGRGTAAKKTGKRPDVVARSFVAAFTAYAQSVARSDLRDVGSALYALLFPPIDQDTYDKLLNRIRAADRT